MLQQLEKPTPLFRWRRLCTWSLYAAVSWALLANLVACGPPPCLDNSECPVSQSCDTKHRICNSVGLPCRPGAERACPYTFPTALGVGPCRSGKQTCEDGGVWSPCVGKVEPGKELCNNIDDDCNGKVDDGLNCTTQKRARIFDIACRPTSSSKAANTPGCSKDDACGCLVDPEGQIYVCAGDVGEVPRWRPIQQVASLCNPNTVKELRKYMCGNNLEMICDDCPNGPISWRKLKAGCDGGFLKP